MSSLPKQWTTRPSAKRCGASGRRPPTKMSELQKTIDLRSTGRSDDALAELESDRGKDLMAAIRQAIAEMRSEETALLERRSTRAAWLEGTGQAVLLASLILVIAFGALALSTPDVASSRCNNRIPDCGMRPPKGSRPKIKSGSCRKWRRSVN